MSFRLYSSGKECKKTLTLTGARGTRYHPGFIDASRRQSYVARGVINYTRTSDYVVYGYNLLHPCYRLITKPNGAVYNPVCHHTRSSTRNSEVIFHAGMASASHHRRLSVATRFVYSSSSLLFSMDILYSAKRRYAEILPIKKPLHVGGLATLHVPLILRT